MVAWMDQTHRIKPIKGNIKIRKATGPSSLKISGNCKTANGKLIRFQKAVNTQATRTA